MRLLLTHLLASFSMILLDFFWIFFVIKDSYIQLIESVQQSSLQLHVPYASLAYVALLVALNFFVIPCTRNASYTYAFLYAWSFGATIYALYTGTCGALFSEWNGWVVCLDILWGGLLFAFPALLINRIDSFLR